MKIPLIGIILNSLLNEYNSGACDNLSLEDLDKLLESLVSLKGQLLDQLDKVLTVEETSKFLNCTRQTLSTYVKEGKLLPKKHLGGVLEFKLKDLKKFIKNNKK